MSLKAMVTDDRITERFVEVALLNEKGQKSKQRFIAENPKSVKARRGDEVELVEIETKDISRDARMAYILPVIGFLLGFFLTSNRERPEQILSGLILGILFFVIAWILNRRSRLLKRQSYRVTKVLKKRLEFYEEGGKLE